MKQPLRALKNSFKADRKASGLLVAIGFVVVISMVVGMVVRATSQANRDAWRTSVVENSFAGARTVAASMAHNAMFIPRNLPPQLGGLIENLDTLILSMEPVIPPGYEIATTPQGDNLAFMRDLGPNNFQYANIEDPFDEWWGYSTARLDWDVYAVVREDSNRARLFDFQGVGMKKRITIDYIPLYQYAIFYEGDMELHPGPVMNVRGRVHTNQDMYLSAVNTLRIHERVSSAGYFYRWTYESGQGADVQVKHPNGNFYGMLGDNNPHDKNNWLDSLDYNWLDESISRWGGNMRDSNHGILPVKPPLPAGTETHTMIQRARSTDPAEVAGIKFENTADLIILGDPGKIGRAHV